MRLATLRIVCKGGRTTSRTDDQLIRLLPLRLDYQQAVSLSGLSTSWLLPMTHKATPNHDEPLIRQLPLRLTTLRIVCKGGRTTSRTSAKHLGSSDRTALPSALLKLLLPGLGRHIVCTPGGCIALCQSTNLSPPQVSSQCAKAKS